MLLELPWLHLGEFCRGEHAPSLVDLEIVHLMGTHFSKLIFYFQILYTVLALIIRMAKNNY